MHVRCAEECDPGSWEGAGAAWSWGELAPAQLCWLDEDSFQCCWQLCPSSTLTSAVFCTNRELQGLSRAQGCVLWVAVLWSATKWLMQGPVGWTSW